MIIAAVVVVAVVAATVTLNLAARCADSMLILQLIDAHAAAHTRFCESTDFKEPCSKMSISRYKQCVLFNKMPPNRN